MVAPESSCFYDRCAAQSGIVRLMLGLPRHRFGLFRPYALIVEQKVWHV